MWFNRWRVEEDLEKIRKVNLADKFTAEEQLQLKEKLTVDATKLDKEADSELITGLETKTELNRANETENTDIPSDDVMSVKPVNDEVVKVGAKDIFAMIIAVFSLILPFVIIMLVVMGLFLLFFFRHIIF